ncbi:hypothetical protein [Pseudoponticoccus marisrubri]|uniref:Uncharacterized protein n=1 Tax=Pseudoponticoccus marisrubri TaxID=1685382 RepID=A0A0W7WMA5_9RHOB|nr:hypothetical protein [Pseudoponticoccus marisrubri]KUF11690.1 hypothetical protein AVJ23_07355 [Pseudoponticoccus marisrubri]
MWTWMQENAAVLGVVLNAAMLLVWMAYLQLIFASFRKANRAVIHIASAVEQESDARCLVTNMGSDTVYLLGIKVDLRRDGNTLTTVVSDRVDDEAPLGGDLRARTNQGPLEGGEVLDIGSFRKICERAARQADETFEPKDGDSVEITVVVAAQQAHRLMGGYKRFEIMQEGEQLRFRSNDVLTRQIGSAMRRRSLARAIAA